MSKVKPKHAFSDNVQFKDVLVLAQEEGVNSITLNVTEVDFIDSAALGMLMLLYSNTRKQQMRLFIKGASGQVAKILRLSKLDGLFELVG